MLKLFRPMLCPNEVVKIEDMKFPLRVSMKLDGCRILFKDGQMYSRALKQFPNVRLHERFDELKKLSLSHNIILDGELLAKSLTFNELSGITRQLDKVLPEDLYFYCFDIVQGEDYDMQFSKRLEYFNYLPGFKYMREIPQTWVKSPEEIEPLYKEALDWGCDGLILRDPQGRYKCGRATVKEGLAYKLKPFQTFDAVIYDVIQATEVREGAVKTINELGRSTTSKKKDDRILINKASAFVVKYEGLDLKVTIAMTDAEKEEIWKNKESYIGRWVEFKGLLVGAKDLPRHPTTLRLRTDKD
jgi:DNA ligase-1